jgi:hypothetical protein
MTTHFKPYSEMVESLFKREGYFDPAQPLVHAAMGVLGEVVELCYSADQENSIEELGDLEFYIEAALQELEILDGGYGSTARIEFHGFILAHNTSGIVEETETLTYANEFFDLCKKVWIYRKPIQEVREKMLSSLALLQCCLLETMDALGTDQEQVRAANQAKLAKRYPNGVYADAAAQARADKPAGE